MADDVTREVLLPAEPDEVWAALTDPDRLAEWLADEVALELEPGGEATFRWEDGELRTGFVEAVEPPALLSLWWGGNGEELTRVEFTLEAVSGGTRLRVVEVRPVLTLDATVRATAPLPPGRADGPQARALSLA